MTPSARHQAVLAGHVLDAQGRPVAGARVELTSAPAALQRAVALGRLRHDAGRDGLDRRPDRATTDSAGRFAFVDLPSGAYTLAASLPGSGSRHGTARGKARVRHHRDGEAELAWVGLELSATTVRGRVTGPDSKAVPLASVQVRGAPERTFTDAAGRYVLFGLEAGPHTLVVRARGFVATELGAAPAEAGAAAVVDVTLEQEVA